MRELEVCAGILIKEGKILLGKRKSYDRFGGKWEFPGGKVEEGEIPEDCIIREIKEELNLDIKDFKHFKSYIHRFKNVNLVIHSFLINEFSGKIKKLEHDSLVWLSLDDLFSYDLLDGDKPLVDYLIESRNEIMI